MGHSVLIEVGRPGARPGFESETGKDHLPSSFQLLKIGTLPGMWRHRGSEFFCFCYPEGFLTFQEPGASVFSDRLFWLLYTHISRPPDLWRFTDDLPCLLTPDRMIFSFLSILILPGTYICSVVTNTTFYFNCLWACHILLQSYWKK